jgi:hypothetical protein
MKCVVRSLRLGGAFSIVRPAIARFEKHCAIAEPRSERRAHTREKCDNQDRQRVRLCLMTSSISLNRSHWAIRRVRCCGFRRASFRPHTSFRPELRCRMVRRLQLLAWARQSGACLIEDDCTSGFAIRVRRCRRCRASRIASR